MSHIHKGTPTGRLYRYSLENLIIEMGHDTPFNKLPIDIEQYCTILVYRIET